MQKIVVRSKNTQTDLPYFFDTQALKEGRRQLQFHRDVPARFGIIPRHGQAEDIRWFEGSPCFILHLTNCFERGDEIIMDGCIMPEPHMPRVGEGGTDRQSIYQKIRAHLDRHNSRTFMHRWRFNLKTGETHEQYLDDEVSEFPVCSNDYVGRPNRYSYNVLFQKGEWLMNGLKRYDLDTGAMQRHEFGAGRYGSEPQIARRIGAQTEDDGYLITFIQDMHHDQGECAIYDAADITRGPLARILLPERLGAGTHSCWIEADRLYSESRSLEAIPGH